MDNNKVLLFTDLHFKSYNVLGSVLSKGKYKDIRFKNILNTLDKIFSIAKKKKIKRLIFLGDLFEDRPRIHMKEYGVVFNKFYDMKDRFEFWFVVGNHDWIDEQEQIHSLIPFKEIGKVFDKPTEIEDILILPYLSDIKKIKKAISKTTKKYCLGHLGIQEAIMDSGYMIPKESKLTVKDFKKFETVFFGHYHKHQQVNNIIYVGSSLQQDFGERNEDKGIIIWDIKENKNKFIVLDSWKFYVVSLKEFKELIKQNKKDGFFKVEVEEHEIEDFKELLKKYEVYARPEYKIKDIKNEDISEDVTINFKELLNKYLKMNVKNKSKIKLYNKILQKIMGDINDSIPKNLS